MEHGFAVRPGLEGHKQTLGMGNLPSEATCVAAIMPSVSAGRTTKAKAPPMNGTIETSDTVVMNKKNSPDMAKG
jgi:hypothetical protein